MRYTYTYLRPGALLLLAAILVTACAPVSPGALPPAPSSPVPADDDLSTARGDANTVYADAAPAAPTAAAPAAPSAPLLNPAADTPPAAPAASPTGPTATPNVLDVDAQVPAMLPAFVGDLAQAEQWDEYTIRVILVPDDLTVLGEMEVEVTNRDPVPLNELYFRLYPNHSSFGGSLIVNEGVRVAGQPVATSLAQDDTLLRLTLAQPLAPGASTLVEMSFTTRTPRGASASLYGAFNYESGIWTLASFSPVLASRDGGAWNLREPHWQGDLAVTETALYDVIVDTPPDWRLIATGVRVEQMPLDHGPRRERFVSGPQRDFFLAAFRGFDQASSVVDGTRIVSYYQPGDVQRGQAALSLAEQSLRTFNDRFGTYPLAELEVVQASLTTFLGVEYPGVILIEEELYRRGGRTFDTTVIHEVGHQWWYSLVGNDVQGEPWLDEGLTSYMQVVYYEGQGNQVAAERELDFFRSQYAAARSRGQDGPVGGPVASFDGNYFVLVYAKGALFFHALREYMGDEAFFRFLQTYYDTYRYEEATGLEMLAVAEDTCGCAVQPLYDAWINDTAPVEIP